MQISVYKCFGVLCDSVRIRDKINLQIVKIMIGMVDLISSTFRRNRKSNEDIGCFRIHLSGSRAKASKV